MTDEELIAALQSRLSIEINFEDAGSGYWSGDHKLIVQLCLDGIGFSEATAYLPNRERESL